MTQTKNIADTQEAKRLEESRNNTAQWWHWGPYLSERQWGTVREDYSADGCAWDYFPHDHARSRAYRWGEDGIAGISDSSQYLCFALALWNGKDSILKERLFGLTGNEGNHGEDVKEYYFYLANTPSHAYMKYLYKYAQNAYPYNWLVWENGRRRGCPERGGFEFELMDTGIFDENRYFDVFVEYAKNTPEDILIKISAANRGPDTKEIYILPTLWFRNTWSWGYPGEQKPSLRMVRVDSRFSVIEASHDKLQKRWLYCEGCQSLLFTDNETNRQIFGQPNVNPYVKDGINQYIVNGMREAVNPEKTGTKASACYVLSVNPGETKTVRLRLSDLCGLANPFDTGFESVFQTRRCETDEFYDCVCPENTPEDLRNIQKQAFAGMLWSKQFYYYVVQQWLDGDPVGPPPPCERKKGRNSEWMHLYNKDIISMPDKWEYPWFAAWDLAFHTIPLSIIDPDFAKRQLHLLTREWYMHPNGQIPAYEWNFGDVNPPVTAWAAWRVYRMEGKMYGRKDTEFLKRMFKKLLLYFTWWVNRKDEHSNNIFEGGFLGLDNISLFDRSHPGISGGLIEQSDGTAWMGMYCLNMLRIASELSKTDATYNEWAGKFLQHFLYIAEAMNCIGGNEADLWDDNDGFYYDILRLPERVVSLKVRSMVGLIPLFAVDTIDLASMLPGTGSSFTDFGDFSDIRSQLDWYTQNRPDLTRHGNIAMAKIKDEDGQATDSLFLSFVNPGKLRAVLKKMLDENEFLSPYGIRALSKYHQEHPVCINIDRCDYSIRYEPAESSTGMFGGNSNWRGPIWFPVNFLIIESLQKFHNYLGDDFKVECPTGSGRMMTLQEVSQELSNRLAKIFMKDPAKQNRRPVNGGTEKFQTDPYWNDLILFYEYFHGDNGAGIGASHQTGWTGLIAKLIQP